MAIVLNPNVKHKCLNRTMDIMVIFYLLGLIDKSVSGLGLDGVTTMIALEDYILDYSHKHFNQLFRL